VIFTDRKKMYIGVEKDGNLVIKGLQGKKKNTPQIFKTAFQKISSVLVNVSSPEELTQARQFIISYLKSIRKQIRAKKVDLEDMAFDVTLSKEVRKYSVSMPQHVRAAKMLEEIENRKLEEGDSIRYVKCINGLVAPVKYADKRDLDTMKYVEHLKSIMSPILEPLEIDFDSEIGGKKHIDIFLAP